jgi:hypothetical protein
MSDKIVIIFLVACHISVWLLTVSVVFVPWITGALYLAGVMK